VGRAAIGCVLVIAACGDNACPAAPDLHVHGTVAVAETAQARAAAPASVAGAGGAGIGSIAIVGGVGTVTVRGVPATAVVYVHGTDWPNQGDSLETALVANDSELDLVWFYCHEGALYHVFYEAADGVHHGDDDATGSCSLDAAAPASTALPAVAFDFPALDPGFQIDGALLQYDGVNPGAITMVGVTATLLPFARVDCSSCAAPGESGWQELHAIVWTADTAELGVAIFYLVTPGQVTLASPVPILPSWMLDDSTVFDATWRTCG